MAKSRRCLWCILSMIVPGAIAIAVVFIVKKKMDNTKLSEGSVDDKYADALVVAMQFFDVQKYIDLEVLFVVVAGKLVDDVISWRGDSGLKDGSVADLDLSKGMYDAGDNLKFGFPMAFTATVLSWAILEYGNHMEHVNHLEYAKGSLRWITDFLINAHPSENVLYIQVGDPEEDHKCWQKPENMTEKRPLKRVNKSLPGSDVAAETAAAMASASLVFKKADSTYSSTLLKHAKQLFTFANKHKGSYTESLPELAEYYNSTGYGDELIWGASWLYHATGDKSYLEYLTGEDAETYADVEGPTWFSWDNKLAGAQVLLSRLSMLGGASGISGLKDYKKGAEDLMCALLPDSPSATSSRTERGLIWISEWDSLQHPVASAFLAALYSDYMRTSNSDKLSCGDESFDHSDLRNFAKSQAKYVLGDNPMEISYLVGYGKKYPKFVHHRGASIPADAKTGCSDGFKWLASKKPNPNVAVGAMVGGPFKNESFIDSRNNSMQTEPTTYNSALLVGLLSSLVTNSDVVKSLRAK
ncbi:hypothetical protein V6N12_035336 [Hibiscus sabdariffa]|uniref:Endoglucanase n=1 Tax=Hibiscus sabdariffa TaxID=183260 RepID=A0ABR2BSA7_9ROSI